MDFRLGSVQSVPRVLLGAVFTRDILKIIYSQQLDFRQGATKASNRGVC